MIKYFTKHVYEVDIVATYLQLENGIKKGQIKFSNEISTSELLSRLKTSLEVILQPDNVDVEILLKDKISAVIMPQFHLAHYEFWFAFQLMVANPRRIPLILSYQLERWSDKHKFLNLVEFRLSEIFENNKPINCDKNADSLFKWIYEKRKQFGYNTKSKQTKLNTAIDNTYEDIPAGNEVKHSARNILLRDEYTEPVAQVFKQFLFNTKDYKNLIAAFKGEALKKPIELTCKVNEFGYMISKLKSEPLNCILSKVDKIRDWAIMNFKFFSGKSDFSDKASPSYMRAALIGSRPPSLKRRKELEKLIQSINDQVK